MEISKEIFIEYRHKIQESVNIFLIGYINFILKGKRLSEYTNLFSPSESKKNEKIILTYFQ